MKRIIHLCSIIAMTVGLAACSDKVDDIAGDNGPEKPVTEAMQFNVSVDGTSNIDTRSASTSLYPDKTRLYIGINSHDKDIDKAMSGKRNTTLTLVGEGSAQTVTTDPILYWNDMGGSKADVDIWGLNLAEQNVTVSETGSLDWKVAADQTAGILPYDLHWSNNATHKKYKELISMEFKHAMSKITMNLTVGEGFTAAEAASTQITYLDNFTETHVEAATTALSDVKGKSNIAPYVVTPFNGGMKATYTAIVVPTRKLAVGDALATIIVSDNTFTVRSKEERTFESGKNYIYNVSVKKSGILVSTVVTDWDDVEGDSSAEIVFTAGAGQGGQNGVGANDLSQWTDKINIFTSKGDKVDYDADATQDGTQPATSSTWVPAKGQEGDADYVPGYWKNNEPIYWQSDNDDTYFRGLSSNVPAESDGKGNFTLKAGDDDYLWGTSGDTPIAPNTGNVNLQFTHTMSQVIVNLKTDSGDAGVNLEGAIVRIVQAHIDGTIDVHTGIITLGAKGECTLTLSSTNKTQHTKYMLPQKLDDNVFVEITTNPDTPDTKNVYKFQMNQAKVEVEGKTQYIDEWKSNTKYIYNIKITKSEKLFTAQICEWTIGFNNEEDIEIKL